MSTRKDARRNAAAAPWTPFVRGSLPEISDAQLQAQADAAGATLADMRAVVEQTEAHVTIWLNSRYQVNRRDVSPDLVHLSVKRRDKAPIHDWRDLQRIKNELVGPEHEAVELYPAESRLVDAANQYHLWVFTDPAYRLPFGFQERLVVGTSAGGTVQRPFAEQP